jgi:hypothetical protein
MALQKREKNMLFMLGGVAVVAVLYTVLTGGKTKTGQDVSQIVNKTAAKLTDLVGVESPGRTGRPPRAETPGGEYSGWGSRDPFSKPEFDIQPGKAPAGNGITIKGIVWMGGKPYVLVNDMILTTGEEKNGYRVERIEGRKVFIRKGGKMVTLLWSKSP